MTTASIGEHGIIGNMRSAALVNVFGAIDFFCFPEFDSPSVFASLLDSERAGSFSIRPAGKPWKGRQIYLPETNVLTTRFISQNSILELCDWMPVGGEALPHCIMRLLTATHGDIEVELRCRPAFQYAGVEHTLELSGESAAFHAASTGLPGIRLRSSVGLRAEGGAAFASFRLREGESAYFILGDAQDEPVNELIPFVRGELQRTCAYWKQWAGKSVYEGRWRESVTRSALTLKLLTSAEHGSLVASPTFGLPELIGGGRNWDYRYTWIRDASFTLYAFYRLGYLEEGRQFFHWLKDRINLTNATGAINVMYRIDGGTDISESELDHLAGYRGSKPVRIGNGAETQLQLDIYGELLDAVYLTTKYGDSIPYEAWNNIKEILYWLKDHWKDPDEGIWEVRGGRKEFLHSRVMCWVAFDRAIRLGQRRSLPGPFEWLQQCRDEIMTDIHENFWDKDLGAFVQYKGSKDVGASALLMPLLRFISPSDPRWISTLAVIERDLVVDTTVSRYCFKEGIDGLQGQEGGFTACSFWLVEALARSHQADKAQLLFEKLLAQANSLGLFAEELSATGEHLGNFPQALSHLALISAATYLDRSLGARKTSPWS